MLTPIIFAEKLFSLTHNTELFTLDQESKGILTEEHLTWLENGEPQTLALKDVVGVSIVPQNAQSQIASFVVNAYPLVQLRRLSRKRQRVLQEYKFACPDTETRSRWLQAITHTLQGNPVNSTQKIPPRRLHVFLNPTSGKKKAQSIFEQVSSVWEKSNCQLSVIETLYAGHAQAIVKKINLEEVDGFVVIGGDGTLYEVINGLMSRCDWKIAILTPFGVIPAGTGNGLCKTILEISGEPYDTISAAFLTAKGKIRPLDLILTEQNHQRYYSFLSLSWAFVSDVDIESNKLRFLGSLKNDIYALVRILSLRTYKGRLSFIPVPNWKPSLATQCKPFDECSICSLNFNPDQKTHPIPLSSALISPFSHIIEDEFIVFWAMNVSWASHSINATPHAHFSDGAMDLLVVRKGISRWQLLSAFLRVGKGKHIELAFVEYYKVRCFRLEPLTKRGILAVDGEQIDYSPIQMQALKGVARVFCR